MKIFHYTRLENWFRLKSGDSMYGDEPGLSPTQRLSPFTKRGWDTVCSFSLLEPEPKQWVRNRKYPRVWNDLMVNTGDMLLEVEVDKHLEDAYVVDFEPREAFARKLRRGVVVSGHEEVGSHEAYVDSMVPLREYLERKRGLGYQLPEVIITRRVPVDDIRVSDSQPKIERRLRRFRKGSRGYWSVRRQIAMIPELRDWARNHGDEDLIKAVEEEVKSEKEFERRWGKER